ncbi:MAG: hypothetical protein SO135_08320 [Sphaerochaetaceae bacterium]|jgi:hypothetical protein|nr:hypothetical protein [Sphaerochaetaceae bacterium]NLY07454.1 hypothetical protein [Spirochaetales bacterium]
MRDEQDAMEFLMEIEACRGGKIGWKTYSTWFSDSSNIREYGVFFYEINGIFYYEDFERKPSLLGFTLPQSKKTPKYVKLEGSFAGSDVTRILRMSKNRAQSYLEHQEREALIREANLFDRLFKQLVTMVELSDGKRFFFEFMNDKEFAQVVQKTHLDNLSGSN